MFRTQTSMSTADRLVGLLFGILAFAVTFAAVTLLTGCATVRPCADVGRELVAAERAAGRTVEGQQFADAVTVAGVDEHAGTAHVTVFPFGPEAAAQMTDDSGWSDAGKCLLADPAHTTIHFYEKTLPLAPVDMSADKRGPI